MTKKSRRQSAAAARPLAASSVLADQFGYVLEGLRTVLGWIGVLLTSLWALLQWAGRRAWEALLGERGRQPLGMVLAAVSIYVFVALFDYRAGEPAANLCGTLGHRAADFLIKLCGAAAYVAPTFGAFWGVARVIKDAPGRGQAAWKLLGALVLTGAVSLGAYGVDPERLTDPAFPEGLGGIVGAQGYPPLAQGLGSFGVMVLLSLLTLLALLLATEWAFVPLIKDLARKSKQGFHQPTLPLEPRRQKASEALEDAGRRRTRLARWWDRTWAGFRSLFQPFQPEDASAAPVARVDPAAVEEKHQQPVLPPISTKLDQEEEEKEEEKEEGEKEERENVVPAPRPRRRPRQPTLGSLPPVDILQSGGVRDRGAAQGEIDAMGRRLQGVFDSFGLEARVVGAERGPTLTLFEVKLGSGVSVKKLKNQRDDLAVQLGSHGVRIVYPLPGRSTVGIEVPNLKRENVFLKNVFEEIDLGFGKCRLPTILGRDTLGRPAYEDLTVMPHMLIAGTTGSGKSVCLNSILLSMLLTRTPDQLRLVLIDPKQVELQLYRDIPHLLCPVVTDMKRAPFTLEWATRTMEDRLHMFKLAGVRNIGDYNQLGQEELRRRVGEEDFDPDEFPATIPYIVLVIDELADLMMVSAKEVEIAVSRLAAKARAAGIHLLVATQRPSTDVVTGLIKMNLPVRISFKVTSAVDSRVILDDGGADLLLGNGDFLYRPPGASGMVRGQGAFVNEREVREVCDHLRAHGKPEFLEDLVQMKGETAGGGAVDDPLYEDAVRIILQSGRGSASLLQRALSVGYTRASRLIDLMTEQGVLGPFTGSKARDVLLSLEEWEGQRAEDEE